MKFWIWAKHFYNFIYFYGAYRLFNVYKELFWVKNIFLFFDDE